MLRFFCIGKQSDFFLFSGFMTSKRELHVVFDIINKDNKYYMQYNEFIVALKPDRHVSFFLSLLKTCKYCQKL